MPAPPLAPPEGWVPVQPFPELAAARSFVSGDPAGERMRVAYFRTDASESLYARAWFGPGAEGPPGQAHGGAIAAVLDEAMGAVTWMHGHKAVAGRIGVTFNQFVPLGTDTTVEAWVDQVDGRKVATRARMTDPRGQLLAESDGVFVVMPPERLAEFART
ncbi:MAG: PaaI family thioesterase [Acidobacteriota bacterium]